LQNLFDLSEAMLEIAANCVWNWMLSDITEHKAVAIYLSMANC